MGCCVWVTAPGDADHLVKIRRVGELAIKSWTLARGYLHSLDKTAAKFMRTPQWLRDIEEQSETDKTPSRLFHSVVSFSRATWPVCKPAGAYKFLVGRTNSLNYAAKRWT